MPILEGTGRGREEDGRVLKGLRIRTEASGLGIGRLSTYKQLEGKGGGKGASWQAFRKTRAWYRCERIGRLSVYKLPRTITLRLWKYPADNSRGFRRINDWYRFLQIRGWKPSGLIGGVGAVLRQAEIFCD